MGENELEILLDESRREYDKLTEVLLSNSTKIISLISLIPVLIGIIITSTFYVFTNLDKLPSDDLFFAPIAISLIILVIAFSLGLIGILPIRSGNFYIPSKLYEIKNEKKEDILDKIIQNYLLTINDLILKLEIRPFLSTVIVVLIVFSLIEYILFGIYHFVKPLRENIIYIPYAILSICIIIILYLFYLNRRKRMKTKELLES
ncbi:MAG: hypothetical protein IMZ43_01070 [Thermoplasmata archaeon]|nr:hypothetical protein [Thermoplasmata archaeon]